MASAFVAAPTAAAISGSGGGAAETPLGLACVDREHDGVRYRKCEGKVRSFDGLPLSTTVTLPAGARGPLPLIVMRHGSHQNKTSWEHEPGGALPPRKRDWNNVAFASRGYAVLTSTTRGWFDSCGPTDRQNAADPGYFARECEGRRYWIHVFDPRWEVRDVQTQIGLLVDEGWADPGAVGVYGLSIGAVETWLLALLGDRTMNLDGTLSRWRSPAGRPLRIAAAMPDSGYAAPLYGYAPNGRARDDEVPTLAQLARPFGVPVESWISYFCALLPATGELAPPGADPTADIATYCRRLLQGNPFRYDATLDPELVAMVDELQFRAPLRYEPGRPRVPIFFWQGLTDSITTGIHGVMMLNWLRALDPSYPVKAWFDDIGHHPASNAPETYARVHAAGHAFFAYRLKGEGDEPVYDVTAASPVCAAADRRQVTLRADRWRELSTGARTFASEDDQFTASTDGGPFTFTGGPFANPCAAAGGLNTTRMNTTRAAWTWAVDEPFVVAGAPELTLRYAATGVDPKIDVRVWDVAPDESREIKLVSRGTYRLEGAFTGATQTLSFQLWPQVWPMQARHKLRLEISGQDINYFQRNNTPFTLSIDRVALRVPIADGS